MSCRSPWNVTVAKGEQAFAAHCKSLPIGCEYPIRGHAPTLFQRVFTCLYRAGSGGIVREPEGIETPLPGKSSERPWSKRREPYFRNVEAVGSNPITSTKKPRSEA